MSIRKPLPIAIYALCCALLSACGSQAGGLGMGFANQPTTARVARLGLQFVRLALPSDRATDPYVEMVNTSAADIDLSAAALKLQSAAGQTSLPRQGMWAAGDTLRIGGASLDALQLHSQAGELVLLRANLTTEAYAAWGAEAEHWPEGAARLASRAGLQPVAVRPLPLTWADDQAIFFARPAGAPGCTSAHADFHAGLTAEPCVGAAAPRVRLALLPSADGRPALLDIINDEPDVPLDLYGLRLCTPHGCRTLTEQATVGGAANAASSLRLTLSKGRHPQRADIVVSLPPVYNGELVQLLAPGESPDDPDARVLAHTTEKGD